MYGWIVPTDVHIMFNHLFAISYNWQNISIGKLTATEQLEVTVKCLHAYTCRFDQFYRAVGVFGIT